MLASRGDWEKDQILAENILLKVLVVCLVAMTKHLA